MLNTITETCKCGAEISLPSNYATHLEAFRVQHASCFTPQAAINEQVVEVLNAVQLAMEHFRLRLDILSAKVDAHEQAIIINEGTPNGTEADT